MAIKSQTVSVRSRFTRKALSLATLVGTASVALLSSTAVADINGFGNFAGFSVQQSDSGPAPLISPGSIRITNASAGQVRSIFSTTPQSIMSFTTSFDYRVLNSSSTFSGGAGIALVLQNSPQGAATLGNSFGRVGSSGIANSAALTLELMTSSSASSYYTNGAVPSGSPSTGSVNFVAGNLIAASITYDGTILTSKFTDTVTGQSVTSMYLANIGSAVGGSTAYVGFTASNTGNQQADQYLSNFTYTQGIVPEPMSAMLLMPAMTLLRRRR